MAWYDSPGVRRALAVSEEAAGAEVDVLLARHRVGRAAWDSPPVRRQRIRALEAQAAREAEASRALRLPQSHDRAHTQACAGPVSLYEPGDVRRVDCAAGWPPPPGTCPCGCGAPADRVTRAAVPGPGR
jgi:hypothetical protein